jgi:uncharacterized protein YgfB (UPF0149 family)
MRRRARPQRNAGARRGTIAGMYSVQFDELDQAFGQGNAPVDPAEAHGSLCGGLCAVPAYRLQDWVDEVLPDAQRGAALRARNLLQAVFDETVQALAGGEMDFVPLLPDDESALEVRVEALADWCGGFLYGLGAGKLPSLDAVPGEVGEVLRDFTEISQASVGDGETEENEAAWVELLEFVRAGTQLVYEELAAHRERGLPPAGEVH